MMTNLCAQAGLPTDQPNPIVGDPQGGNSIEQTVPQEDVEELVVQGRVTGRRQRRQRRIQESAQRRAAREEAYNQSSRSDTTKTAAEAWDAFYTARPTFFKDRHLLRSALPELMPLAVRQNPRAHIPPLVHSPSPVAGPAQLREQPLQHDESARELLIDRSLRPQHHLSDGDSSSPSLYFVEAGCGVGNALFPVLRANPAAYAYAFDFSAKAIEILRCSSEYHPSRVDAFVADLARPETYITHISRPVDYVLAIWALSALRPGEMISSAASGLASLLRPGGMVLLRDYADGDMRLHLFRSRDTRAVSSEQCPGAVAPVDQTLDQSRDCDRLFTRGDGTWAYFFRTDELSEIMGLAGLETVECRVEERTVHNRKNNTTMQRRWIIGRFRKPLSDACTA